MRSAALLLLLSSLVVDAAWTPSRRSDIDPVTRNPVTRNAKSQTCVVAKSQGNNTDDAPNFVKAAQQCKSDGVIVFQEGVDYNIFTPINATLSNVEVQIKGNLHLPQDIPTIQAFVNKTTGGNLPWISLSGTNIALTGVQNVTTGWIYGYGENWWNANVKNGTGLAGRPHLIKFNATGGYMSDLKHKKPIAWVHALYGNNIYVRKTFIDATTAPGGGFPFNTATNVLIEDSVIRYYESPAPIPSLTLALYLLLVSFLLEPYAPPACAVVNPSPLVVNGDDAITVENGAENVTVRNALIGGPGCHGTSVGSLGQDQTVFNRVKNNYMRAQHLFPRKGEEDAGGKGQDSCDGAQRSGTWQIRSDEGESNRADADPVQAQNVTWQNYHVENVTFPIYVTQTYVNQGSAQTQNSGEGSNTTATVNGRLNNASVVMENFTYENWTGTINTYQRGDWSCVTNPCWYDVPGADGTQSIVIQCSNSTSCSDYQLKNIQVTPMSSKPASVLCTYLDAKANPQLGFVCTNGTYVPTL
ncbi:hypothetical protein JCM24511_03093 [Saitozyma sp. JCM 24511]|nr:hypothetical protein JCM24511_03093 [Saitozyma sp. JCM 24511]